jgi:hypothetical protein
MTMKKVLIATLALAAFTASAHMKPEQAYRFAGDQEYAAFCKAVVSDDVKMLKRKISAKVGLLAASRKEVLRKLLSSDGMKCNGSDLLEFSKQREASEVLSYLITKA